MVNRACILLLIASVSAFTDVRNVAQLQQHQQKQQYHHLGSCCHSLRSNKPLHLVPLTRFADSISFFSQSEDYSCIGDDGYFRSLSSSLSSSSSMIISDTKTMKNDGDADADADTDLGLCYELGLVEENELPELARFVVSAFGAEAITLSQDMNSFERMLMNPAAEFLNGYSGLVAFAEVYSGTRQRISNRFLQQPSQIEMISAPELTGLSHEEKIRKAERESIVLVLARQTTDDSIDVIASIELRLQPCDAKIPFSIPWLDRVERKLWKMEKNSNDLQPYLSNLCVDEKFRGQKIGRGLVRCVENIAKTCWGYNRIYLHVDEDNLSALNLYKSEGYRDVGHRWNPFWSGDASKIGYYVKSLP